MLDLKEVTSEQFSALRGQSFHITSLQESVSLDLVEVKKLGAGEREGGAFSALWQGPVAPGLTQGSYEISHQGFGKHHVFLVPVAQTEAGFQYEAVFT